MVLLIYLFEKKNSLVSSLPPALYYIGTLHMLALGHIVR